MPLHGVVIDGSTVNDVAVPEAAFDKAEAHPEVPIARALGIPLVVAKAEASQRPSALHVGVRLMTNLSTGVAPREWDDVGKTPRRLTLLRTDGVPFTVKEWQVLDDFLMDYVLGEESFPCTVERSSFARYVETYFVKGCFPDLPELLPKRFPKGAAVAVSGLMGAAELNGCEGKVAGHQGSRVGVEVAGRTVAVRPHNLTLVSAPGVGAQG